MSYMRLLLAGIAAVIAGCGAPHPHERAPRPLPVVSGVPVEAVRAEQVPEHVEASGTVRSRHAAALSSRIVAQVRAVHVREGERVTAGQLLVELDGRDVRAALAGAEAGVRAARESLDEVDSSVLAARKTLEAALGQEMLHRATHKRYLEMLERKSVVLQEFDEVVARLSAAVAEVERARAVEASLIARRQQMLSRIEQAEAEVAAASAAVDYPELTAPVDGIVASRTVEVGSVASPGQPLLVIEEERYRLETTVQESEIARIRAGQPAEVLLESLGRTLAGTVTEITPSSDTASRTFNVKVDLDAVEGLRSGLYARARFEVGRRRTLTAPASAVFARGQLDGVFAVDAGGVARWRLVKPGRRWGDRVELLAGIDAGDRLATGDLTRLADPCRVEAAP